MKCFSGDGKIIGPKRITKRDKEQVQKEASRLERKISKLDETTDWAADQLSSVNQECERKLEDFLKEEGLQETFGIYKEPVTVSGSTYAISFNAVRGLELLSEDEPVSIEDMIPEPKRFNLDFAISTLESSENLLFAVVDRAISERSLAEKGLLELTMVDDLFGQKINDNTILYVADPRYTVLLKAVISLSKDYFAMTETDIYYSSLDSRKTRLALSEQTKDAAVYLVYPSSLKVDLRDVVLSVRNHLKDTYLSVERVARDAFQDSSNTEDCINIRLPSKKNLTANDYELAKQIAKTFAILTNKKQQPYQIN